MVVFDYLIKCVKFSARYLSCGRVLRARRKGAHLYGSIRLHVPQLTPSLVIQVRIRVTILSAIGRGGQSLSETSSLQHHTELALNLHYVRSW